MTLKEKAILTMAIIIFLTIFSSKFFADDPEIDRTTITLTNEDLGVIE